MIDEKMLVEEIKQEASTRLNGFDAGISLGDMLEWVEQMPKCCDWISCGEQSPKKSWRYLLHFNDEIWGECVEICIYQHLSNHWYYLIETVNESPDTWKKIDNAIEWQPLPKIYK